MTYKQQKIIDRLDALIKKSKMLSRFAKKKMEGHYHIHIEQEGLYKNGEGSGHHSAEDAFFLKTDRGITLHENEIENIERFVMLMLALKWEGTNIAMIKEDIPKGIVLWKDMVDDEWLCNKVRQSVGLNQYTV